MGERVPAVLVVFVLLLAPTAATAQVTGANLSVSMIDSPDPVLVAELLTYTMTIQNDGPAVADSVSLSEDLPGPPCYPDEPCDPEVEFVSAEASQGECGGEAEGYVECFIGDLPARGTATVDVTVRPREVGTIHNFAHTGANNESDYSNNDAGELTTVTDSLAGSDLVVTQQDGPDPAYVGDPVTYTVQIHNQGPATAEGVAFSDDLPGAGCYADAPCDPDHEFVSAEASQGECFGEAEGFADCTIGSIPPRAVVDVEVTVRMQKAGTFENVASAGSVNENDPADNESSELTTVKSPYLIEPFCLKLGPSTVCGAARSRSLRGL